MDNFKHWTIVGRRGVLCIIGFMLFFLPACSPKIVEKVRTEYVYQDVHHRDTIITKDSVYIREWMKGDTIYVEKYKDKYVYRDRWRDSIRTKEVHDTTTVEKLVEKELNWAQKTKISLFPWLLAAVLGLTAWVTKKWWLPLVK